MDLRVLGAVEAWSAGRRLDLGSRKQRLVLAVLALEANRSVPVDRLIDLVWGPAPPASARGTVQTLVSRLRTAFRQADDPPEIANEGAGYVLRVDPAAVDAHRFARLVALAREADDERAAELLGRALALWRGEPLADAAPPEVRDRLCGGLREARWTALEDWLEILVRLGEGRQVLDELTEAVAEQPVRQRLVGLLMHSLHREGRTNDALAAYRALRTRLADEFGLDPAPELRELETRILRGDPPPDAPRATERAAEPARPAELPHDVAGFVGREAELAKLDAGTGAAGGPAGGTDIWVVSGAPGVGKTALALRWAHRARERFPDGQLYVDLRGFDAEHEPLPPSAALAQLLRGLGCDPRSVPPDLDGQAKLFRSTVAGRRVLVVLDNARDAAQVTPLLPPSGAVLVTSRNRLGELVALAGARALPLDVLPERDSLRLLEEALGREHVSAEPAAAAQLARLCGHLPLALRIAAANAAAGPEPELGYLVRELSQGDLLAELTVDGAGESPVARAMALSYRALPAEQRRLFRGLGAVPGRTFTAEAVSALVGQPQAVVNRQLKALAAAHLVERHGRGRYRSHDLLRRYAVDRAEAEDDEHDRERARERLYEHYLSTADAAGRALIPHFLRLPRPTPPTDRFPDADAALAWLDEEWANLTAAVDAAARRGPRPHAWHLADALRAFFHHRGHHAEWLAAASAGLAAAHAAGDRRAQAAMHQSIALACVNNGRYEEAVEHLTAALRGHAGSGWAEGEAAALNNLSAAHQRLGAPREAIACGLRSLRLYEEQDNPAGITMSLANVGFAYWQLGELTRAREHFGRALELGERTGARFNVAVLLVDLGNAHRDLGEHDAAEDLYARALGTNRELGYRYGEATALAGRALLRCTTGVTARTRADAELAVELTERIGDRGTLAWTLNALGAVCLRLGAAAEAQAHHLRALELARETSFSWGETDALTRLAAALVRLGDLDQAQLHGEVALERARACGYRPVEIRALRTLSRVRVRRGQHDLAAQLSDQAQALFAETGYHPDPDLDEHPHIRR
ncbi:DNA-binding SARP family transcriptional activator/DNA-binding transcriptional ArsR family regulator [Saccharothrix coeruleofusca]|uniref:AfsR/SARP family transcriptional regulator n=1 Tax=Saccharothrix coeruleofusca TaxID=33919 RepID=UPI001AE7B3FD|nr:BTAD domain-containing putative transcriptional regulator [Saccharothrix coeruleofusca]MBP2340809.1 DNA-binding SARP family transcriptional activator/DNA-binding transcriptional ArsR family regulator [Saccharothrix coeruleofusca]